MGKKIKVLQINASTEYGGVSSMLFNIYKNIDRERFYFDFLSPNKTSFTLKKNEIEQMGGKILGLDVNEKNKILRLIKIYLRLRDYLKKNQYDIIHINSGSRSYNALTAFCCKHNSKSKVIVHSHNGLVENSMKSRLMRKIIEKNADMKLSCSDIASKAMFERLDDVVFIRNGIDVKVFEYSNIARNKIRKEFCVKDNEKLIGNIGRMTDQKNQLFLLKVFSEIKKENTNAKLIIVGDGVLRDCINKRIEDLGLVDSVIITSNRNDMPAIYSALDVFVLPSLYEGLPVSAIEAQYNGLPTILADTITEECKISDNASFISIKDLSAWKDSIEHAKRKKYKIVNQFSIQETAKMIGDKYLKLWGSQYE